jgi:hypothetical protein
MRRPLLSLAFAALLALATAVPALASEKEMCMSGAAFGAMHAEHARAGMLDGAMNPGMHQGFSVCLP